MLSSGRIVECVAAFLADHRVPLVVDPVMTASSGALLLSPDAVSLLPGLLFPVASVVTPNLDEAIALAGFDGPRRDLAERLVELGAPAVIVTGGHGAQPVDHLFDGREHLEIEVPRHSVRATHGAGCTHSATLCALLAQGHSLREAAKRAAQTASEAVAHGDEDIGAGDGPVRVLDAYGPRMTPSSLTASPTAELGTMGGPQ
jgi:hydroxymethylpyrimidine/phosphomethylpyrimidine kinase